MKKAIFIADAHLKSPEEEGYQDIVSFFDSLKEDKELDALFVLGDLFDFFVGFPKIVFYEHLEVLQRLKELAESGISVFYFEGNHDFFLKKLNRLGFPVHIIEGSMDLYLDGRKFFLSHGDRIDKTDYAHHILSFLVKNPITNLFSYILPPYLVYDFAHLFSRFSREKISSKRVFKTSLLSEFAKEYAKIGYGGAVLGHFHKSMVIEKVENSIPVYLVGSWKEGREYLLWENGNFCFKTFGK
ncbi:MAG: UDP-2,3-diacylglucosamine diphosphatase [bacterium]